MGAKAIEGFFVGNDGDERYRTYVQRQRKVVVSRVIRFLENLKSCYVSKFLIRTPLHAVKAINCLDVKGDCNIDESIKTNKAVD